MYLSLKIVLTSSTDKKIFSSFAKYSEKAVYVQSKYLLKYMEVEGYWQTFLNVMHYIKYKIDIKAQKR